jgi:nucleoside-diphosphate-sugar epimerase
MKNILISGITGFVGSNLKDYLALYPVFNISPYNRNNTTKYIYETDVIIHLAGKAHDLKKVSSPDQYYKGNTDLTKQIFDAFLESNAKVFLTLSSVKAVADEVDGELNEKAIPNPITHYGKSKLKAEEYIFSHVIPEGKRVYVLRPCMIHGPGNKGNLNLLYSLVSKGLPWPLGSFENSRSFLSIENLCFSIKEFIDREGIPSGIYNIADDVPLSTNEVINIIAESKGKKAIILNLNTTSIKFLSRLGDFLKLPLNSERLRKLTESYVVNNSKLIDALGKPFPISSKEGLFRTFQSFAKNV